MKTVGLHLSCSLSYPNTHSKPHAFRLRVKSCDRHLPCTALEKAGAREWGRTTLMRLDRFLEAVYEGIHLR